MAKLTDPDANKRAGEQIAAGKGERFGLNEADLAQQSPQERALDEAQEAFVRGYCRERGWPEDPARLTPEQLGEILGDEGYPR